MKSPGLFLLFFASMLSANVHALEMAPEEFTASREMVCVLAQESLGELSEEEYGKRMGAVLKDFDSDERSTILAKALGYFDGLMFSIAEDDTESVNARLRHYMGSATCADPTRRHAIQL